MNLITRFLKFLFFFRPQVHALDESAYGAIAGQQFAGWLVRRIILLAFVSAGAALLVAAR